MRLSVGRRPASPSLEQSLEVGQQANQRLGEAAAGSGEAEPAAMADDGAAKKRTFRKFTYRGVDLDQLLDMSTDDLVDLFPARARRK